MWIISLLGPNLDDYTGNMRQLSFSPILWTTLRLGNENSDHLVVLVIYDFFLVDKKLSFKNMSAAIYSESVTITTASNDNYNTIGLFDNNK